MLVIDDGSSDRSAAVAQEAGVNLLRNPKNLGRNRAVVRGLRWGLEQGYSLFICVDADGQHPVNEIPRIIRRFAISPSPDCLIMSRFMVTTQLKAVPKVDALGILVSSFLISWSAKCHISDPTTGYIAFSPRAARCLVRYVEFLRSVVSDNTWAMAQYPLFARKGLSIVELSTHHVPRKSGKRKMFSPTKRLLYPFRLAGAFVAVRIALSKLSSDVS